MMTTASPDPPIQLNYARQPPRWRRWAKGLFVLAWIAWLGGLAYDKWGVLVRVRLAVVLAERACLSHTEPADRVVIDLDPGRTAQLVKLPGYRVAKLSFFGRSTSGIALTVPVALFEGIGHVLNDYATFRDVSDKYEQLRNPTPPPDIPDFSDEPDGSGDSHQIDDQTGVFAHGRCAAGHATRLVCINGCLYAEAAAAQFVATLYEPSNVGSPTWMISDTKVAVGDKLLDPIFRSPDHSAALRFFAGQPDPDNTARFTIRYDTATGDGMIEGVLGADDKVTFRILSGPLIVGLK